MIFDEETDSRRSSSSDCVSYQSIPDADRELAAQALYEFEQQNYEQSFIYLKKLYAKRPQDLKVYHNCAVVEFYLSSCKATHEFSSEMNYICKQAHINLLDLEALDDVDYCVALYNQAVNSYHFHQYQAAISVLDKIFQYIEPLEESLAKNVCFLLLECYICMNQPKRVLWLIGYMETMLIGTNRNCNSKSNQKEKDSLKEDSESGLCEASKRKLQLCKARCYAMMKTSKACKREIKNLMSNGSQVQNIPAFYLKSQLEYLRGNYKKALKLLNCVTLPDDFSKYFKTTGDCLPAAFYNNVGCIHFYMGKPNLGQFYTEKALAAFNNEITSVSEKTLHPSDVRPMHLMSLSTRHQLLYNLGMQYLQARNFKKAFECFYEVLPVFSSNPRLWLRAAECCIHLNKPDCTDQFSKIPEKSFIKTVVGMGSHRKLILNVAQADKSSVNAEGPGLQFAIKCLKNALCLINESSSSSSGDSLSSILPSPDETDASCPEEQFLQVLPTNFLQGSEIQSLRNSILAAASYVSLCVGDVVFALECAKTLLNQPRISAAHRFLAHLYAGESLLIMDKITEAVEHISIAYSNDIDLSFSVKSSENTLKHQTRFDSKFSEKNDDGSRPVGNTPNWMPDTLSTAKFVTQYNLAVAYALREEWSKALDCLLQMNPNGNVPTQALSLLIYVQTHQGSAEDIKSYVAKQLGPTVSEL